jgi:hypothetical protein
MCEFLDHWQVLIAGVLSVIAALAVVGVTLLSEHRKRKHELKILRRSLGIEVRQYLANAHRARKELREMIKAAATNAIAVEDRTKFPPPSIYPHAAARIAEFGSAADTIVSFFNKITAVGEGATRLTRHSDASNLPPGEIAPTVDALHEICKAGTKLLPDLKTDIPSQSATDAEYQAFYLPS